jgi:hypothetical protein
MVSTAGEFTTGKKLAMQVTVTQKIAKALMGIAAFPARSELEEEAASLATLGRIPISRNILNTGNGENYHGLILFCWKYRVVCYRERT